MLSNINMKYLYLVTIKNNSFRYTPLCELQNIVLRIETRFRIDKVPFKSLHKCEELDNYQRWHLHIIYVTERIPFFRLYQVKGYTVHFQAVPLEDYESLLRYVKKDIKKDILERNVYSYANHHYMFRAK